MGVAMVKIGGVSIPLNPGSSAYVCTSTTRPPAVGGQVIYETDTRAYRIYDPVQAAWVVIGSALVAIRRYKVGTASIASGAFEQVAFGTSDYSYGDISVSTDRDFTVATAGLYSVSTNITFDNGSSGRRAVIVTKNTTAVPTGTSASVAGDNRSGAAAGSTTLSAQSEQVLAAGDTLRVWASQTSGAALNLVPDFGGCEIMIRRITAF
jgi:hypothetical protein